MYCDSVAVSSETLYRHTFVHQKAHLVSKRLQATSFVAESKAANTIRKSQMNVVTVLCGRKPIKTTQRRTLCNTHPCSHSTMTVYEYGGVVREKPSHFAILRRHWLIMDAVPGRNHERASPVLDEIFLSLSDTHEAIKIVAASVIHAQEN